MTGVRRGGRMALLQNFPASGCSQTWKLCFKTWSQKAPSPPTRYIDRWVNEKISWHLIPFRREEFKTRTNGSAHVSYTECLRRAWRWADTWAGVALVSQRLDGNLFWGSQKLSHVEVSFHQGPPARSRHAMDLCSSLSAKDRRHLPHGGSYVVEFGQTYQVAGHALVYFWKQVDVSGSLKAHCIGEEACFLYKLAVQPWGAGFSPQ